MTTTILPLAAIILVGVSGGGLAQSATPSFDCSKAQTADERTICGDPRLAELDQAVAIAFNQAATQDRQAAREIAAATLVARRGCGTDKLCILDQQANAIGQFAGLESQVPVPPWTGAYRIELFRAGGATTDGLPRQVGQCTLTKIAAVSTRFGEELRPPTGAGGSSGTAISYANRGGQVSYDYVDAIAESRIGDGVLLCLVSVPRNCPPGDDRGKVYSATNLRTRGSWTLPDAQHMCGGA
jgi:uncharacterized protein